MIVHEGDRHKRLPRKIKKRIKRDFAGRVVSAKEKYRRILRGEYTFAPKSAWGKNLEFYYNVDFTVSGYSIFKKA